jgi:hypothetical protein
MPDSWTRALNAYDYPARLSDYSGAGGFADFFTQVIVGDRPATTKFEDYFRAASSSAVEVYFEAVFWRLYRLRHARDGGTERVVTHVQSNGISASKLRSAIERFVAEPTIPNLTEMRRLLGIRTEVMTLALTFPAFVDPVRFAMIDRRTARWVNENLSDHNRGRRNTLRPFAMNHETLRDEDFEPYLNWVGWCVETAYLLTHQTDMRWRARDAEMAVFTAARGSMPLNAL